MFLLIDPELWEVPERDEPLYRALDEAFWISFYNDVLGEERSA